jgi:aminopeptidase N
MGIRGAGMRGWSVAGVVFLALVNAAAPAHAQRLPSGVAPSHYDLAFSVDLARARFDGTETIRVELERPTRTVVLHALEITFRDVTITAASSTQKAAVALNPSQQTATLTVPNLLPKGPADLHITYGGILNDKLRGFYLSTEESGRRHAVTQLEATDARRAFPSFDEPALKATFDISLTIDRGDTAISNGRVISDTPSADGRQHTVRFSTTPKMSTYLVALAVGRFECVESAAENVPIRICATEGKKELGRTALDLAGQLLTFYNQYFTIKYPFGKLDVLAVSDFAAGAMENTAAIFYRETDLLVDANHASLDTRKRIASVLAHEMAHQWFGDLVTMKWWDDLWLNEGFATWMANRALAVIRPEWNVGVDEAMETQQALGLDALKSTHAVHALTETPAEIDEAFDSIAYEKGGSLLRMTENYVGAETFRKGINAYLQEHRYSNGTSEDFWNAMTVVSGKPIDRILPTFVNQPGAPLVEVAPDCRDNRTRIAVAQERFFQSRDPLNRPSSERWQVPVCLKTAADGRGDASCDVVSQPRQELTLEGSACSSWLFANAGARGYYRTAYSHDALAALVPRIQEALTPPERLSLTGDEWALVRAGRHGVGEFLTLATGFANERTAGVLSNVTDRLDFIHHYLTTGSTRAPFEAFVRELLGPLMQQIGFESAPSDSDEQRALRATLIETLGTTGADAEVAASARAALDRALAGGTPLDPTLAAAIIAVAAEHGDRALQDALLDASSKATAPGDHYRYLYALARFRDPTLLDRALEYSLTSKLRSQDASAFFSRFLRQEAARPRAWVFLKEHWSQLKDKVAIFGGDTGIAGALGSFCDAASRDDITTFFAAHPLPAATRTLGQTVERINSCIAIREKQAPLVEQWLKQR